MPAFNHRFERATLGGYPIYAAIGGVVAIFCIMFTIVIHIAFIQFVCGVLAAVAIVITFFFLWLGEDITFLKSIWMSYRESRCDYVTHECSRNDE